MSTSEKGAPNPPNENVAAAQLTHEIERLANEMFLGSTHAVPGGGISPGAQVQDPHHQAPVPVEALSVPLIDSTPSATPYFLPSMAPENASSAAPASASASASAPASASASAPASAPATATGPTPAFATELSPDLVPDLHSRNSGPPTFDAHAIKRDFPILHQNVHGKPLVWLDNAATTQKPNAVIDRISHYYRHENSNVHRGAHTLAARATDAYEGARNQVRRFLNASSTDEIVFVRGATEAINLVAGSWGRRNIEAGDEIVITHLEHHANIVPWQMLCREKNAKLRVAPVDSTGQIILEEYERLFSSKTKLAAIPQVSNALGTITPLKDMIEIAHRWGACVLVDGAQSVSHMAVDVQQLDCELFVLSGHKIFAPTGIGVLYGKKQILAAMPPWQGGGNMIADVTFEKTVYQPPPWRFEAGTGSIADAVGLGAALEYVSSLGLPNIARHEHELRVYAEDCLRTINGLTIIGTAKEKAGVISFVLDGVRTEDVGGMLDQEGIAVRSGHHCAQPILRRFGLEATVRASLAPYNTREDIDALVAAVRRIQTGRPEKIAR